jgi:hypothetical protein
MAKGMTIAGLESSSEQLRDETLSTHTLHGTPFQEEIQAQEQERTENGALQGRQS